MTYRNTVAALSVLALLLFAYPVVRSGIEIEIDYNEGWNVFQQLRAQAWTSLYSGQGPMLFNNYPPLSFYLVGGLGVIVGDPLLAGRLLSLAATLVIAVSSGLVVRGGGGGRSDAILAAATCLGLFSAFATDYVGINDPQLLAQAFLCAGFALYVSGTPTPGRLALVALLFSAGLLTKHNVLALPLVVTVHILWRTPKTARTTYLVTGIGIAALSAGLIHLLAGPDFFRQLLAPRTYDVARGFLLTIEVLGKLHAPLGIVGLFLLLTGRRHAVTAQVAATLALSLLLGMGFSGGAGVDINIFFDSFVALAMGTGLAAAWIRQNLRLPPMAPAVLAVTVNAGVILFAPLALGRMAEDVLEGFALRQRLFGEDAAYLRTTPGTAICESMLLCLRAGKPILVDPYNTLQATLTGRLPADQVTGMLARGEIAVAQISSTREHPVDEAPGLQVMPVRFINFGDPVFDALEQSYRVDRVGLSGRFWRPRGTPQ
ncbi:conserved membrane hypothetical protein [Candidatus Terasakiella magnetica]|nr:conserved membrane hypothetical protein [Candidatus Terasakiella magnetica]